MPARSERQRRLFGMALAYKRGEVSLRELPKGVREDIKRIAKTMTEEEIRKYAKKRKK
jgi:Protein of unknwon function (DUF3008).